MVKHLAVVLSLFLAAARQAASTEKKLSGAAKNGFEKKCVTDAVG